MNASSGLIIRPATREDIEAFSSIQNAPTVRAFAAVLDSRVIALGGAALVRGRWFAFLDLTQEARSYKMHIMRSAIRFISGMRRMGVKFIYTEADLNEPRSLAWLASLGFERDPRVHHLHRLKL